jgi:hypothetical protein
MAILLNRKLIIKSFLNISLFLVFLMVLAVVLESNNLRPTSDDYCFGSISADGAIGGVIRWWNTWSANLFSLFIQNLLVGLPLLHLPWEVASAIPFIFAALGMGIAIIYLTPRDLNHLPKLFLITLLAFSWWAFLWGNELMGASVYDDNVRLAYGLTHWQTLNGAYVIPPLILLSIWSEIWNHSSRISGWTLFLTIFLGFMGGTSVTTLSLALIVICAIVPIYSWIFKLGISSQRTILWLVLFVSITIGTAVSSKLSPGQHIRISDLGSNFELTWDRIEYLRFIVVPIAISQFIKSYFSWSSLIIFILISCVLWLVTTLRISSGTLQKKSFNCDWFLDAGLMMAGFSFLQLLIVRVAEDFAYPAYWHYASPLVCVFLSIYFFGVWAGTAMAVTNKKITIYFILPSLSLAMILGAVANLNMVHSMIERNVRWNNGAAPVSQLGLGDIENNDYVGICWERLDNFRDETTKRGH